MTMAVFLGNSFGGPFLKNQTELLLGSWTKMSVFCPVEDSTKISPQLTKISGTIDVEVVEMNQ